MKQSDIKKVVESLILPLDKNAVISVEEKEGWRVKIDSEDSGLLIGKMGESLESIQYILRIMVAKAAGEFIPLVVDVAGYRENKTKELEEFAVQVAENVKKSGYAQELRPMSAYERRIIHAALTGFEGIETGSIGEGELRRIEIRPKKS